MLPFNLHPTLIWAIAFCCLCLTMYLCTFRSYLKGVKGPISQLASSMPLSNFTPKGGAEQCPATSELDRKELCHSETGRWKQREGYHHLIPGTEISCISMGHIQSLIQIILSHNFATVRNSAVTIFVIDVEAAKMGQDHVLQGSPATLNMEAILKSEKVKRTSSDSRDLVQSDSLTNLLLCDEKSDSFRF